MFPTKAWKQVANRKDYLEWHTHIQEPTDIKIGNTETSFTLSTFTLGIFTEYPERTKKHSKNTLVVFLWFWGNLLAAYQFFLSVARPRRIAKINWDCWGPEGNNGSGLEDKVQQMVIIIFWTTHTHTIFSRPYLSCHGIGLPGLFLNCLDHFQTQNPPTPSSISDKLCIRDLDLHRKFWTFDMS